MVNLSQFILELKLIYVHECWEQLYVENINNLVISELYVESYQLFSTCDHYLIYLKTYEFWLPLGNEKIWNIWFELLKVEELKPKFDIIDVNIHKWMIFNLLEKVVNMLSLINWFFVKSRW